MSDLIFWLAKDARKTLSNISEACISATIIFDPEEPVKRKSD
jgi:hypothetical protein